VLRRLLFIHSRDSGAAMARQLGGVRGGLTLEKLASFDDLITDALVDTVSRTRLHEGLY
jgi:hypothetical protein